MGWREAVRVGVVAAGLAAEPGVAAVRQPSADISAQQEESRRVEQAVRQAEQAWVIFMDDFRKTHEFAEVGRLMDAVAEKDAEDAEMVDKGIAAFIRAVAEEGHKPVGALIIEFDRLERTVAAITPHFSDDQRAFTVQILELYKTGAREWLRRKPQ